MGTSDELSDLKTNNYFNALQDLSRVSWYYTITTEEVAKSIYSTAT